MTVRLLHGDCRRAMRLMAARGVMVDAIVTDPPYHLTSIVKRFGAVGAAPAKDRDGLYRRASAGFMGQQWDGGDIAFDPETWALAWRVLKPGGHLLSFGGTRGFHRLACAIEDAGFEIRDTVMYLYGSGFPKSHNVAKAIDKAARGVPHGGADPTSVNHGRYRTQASEGKRDTYDAGQGYGAGPGQFMQEKGERQDREYVAEAAAWDGWGTALKPAFEPIILARKPLSESSIAANVLRHGTGAINVDGCRVEAGEDHARNCDRSNVSGIWRQHGSVAGIKTDANPAGRWPANVCHDGSDEVEAAFAAFGDAKSGGRVKGNEPSAVTDEIYGQFNGRVPYEPKGDSGTAARFFYSAKAGPDDRFGSKHPTVKPVALMRWLVRLVTPPGGTVLDPFAGSGTTGIACMAEGFHAVLCERKAEYVADIRARLDHYEGKGKHSAAVKHRNRDVDPGPLFKGAAE